MIDEIPTDPEPSQDWYFTFGHGQRYFGRYVVIHGTFHSSRQRMHETFGPKWSMQYGSAGEAGVERWGLIPMALPEPLADTLNTERTPDAETS